MTKILHIRPGLWLGAGLMMVAIVAAMPAAKAETGLGASVRANIAAQTVNPEGHPDRPAVTDGQRVAASMSRYRNGGITPLARADARSTVGQQGGAVSSNAPQTSGND